MKFAIVATLSVIALLGASIEAYPQQATFQKLPYYPPPTRPPRPIRVRRETVLGGNIATNPAGGNNARVDLTHGIGTPDHNVIGQVFAAGNTKGGPVATGGTLAYNNNGFGAAIGKEHIPNFGKQLELGGKANLWSSQDRNTRLDLTGTASKWTSGPFSGQKNYGAGLGLSHNFG